MDDVLPTVSTALRLYNKNHPVLRMWSRQYNRPNGVTEWKIKCNGKAIGAVTLRPSTKGVRFGYAIAPEAKSELLPVAKHEVVQIFSDIKNRIDFEHLVGVHWEILDIPSGIQVRKKWYQVWQTVLEIRDEYGCRPNNAEILDRLGEGYDRLVQRSTLKKIIAAGDAGKLDHMKSY